MPSSPLERYVVEHETRYAYTAPVSQSWQLARLTPRALPWQNVVSHSLQIDPPPDERRDELDSFGNTVTHFGLHGAHRVLRVRMQCVVEVMPRLPVASAASAGDRSLTQAQAQGNRKRNRKRSSNSRRRARFGLKPRLTASRRRNWRARPHAA